MTTLSRSTNSVESSPSYERTQSDFDAGINSSSAWTKHFESESIYPSDDDDDDHESYQSARALYDFQGKAEFRELCVEAGDELDIVKEELADGWSLVKSCDGEIGLLPRTYYTFTSNFTTSPGVEPFTTSGIRRQREASSSTITPHVSSRSSQPSALPILPQYTGEWIFPSFRQSLLGGKSLNRFSSFVTSGAEEWVLKGSAADTVITKSFASTHEKLALNDSQSDDVEPNRTDSPEIAEADHHFVDSSHSWKEKLPPFRIIVHSPSKRTSSLSGAFTIYNVTSLFRNLSDNSEAGERPNSPPRITVQRRYSQFVLLHTALARRLPGIALPPLPEKQYAGRFNEDFVEARRGDLERYISRVVRHPVARYAEIVTFFLSCEDDVEWKRLAPQHLALPTVGPSFYARVFHPAFNLDLEDAEEVIGRFTTHTKGVGKGVQGLRNIFGKVREAHIEMSNVERLLSYSLLSLITCKPLSSAPTTGIAEEDEQYNSKDKGLVNEEGAWCWKERCQECLQMTKAIQKTAETLQTVADLYDDHARRTQLITHEALKSVAHPSSIYQGVISTHKSTVMRYREAINATEPTNDDVAGRCETVLNATMAEMETYHAQKIEDFSVLTKEHLDGEIAFYEQVLSRLKNARQNFELPQLEILASSPRTASIYERELEAPRLNAPALLQPCPHVFDSAPMRPVSVAVQEGVSMLLRPSSRGSVFSKFW